MTHDELRSLVPLLALDALPAGDEERQLMAHLEACSECVELLAGYRRTAGLVGLAAPPIEPSSRLRESLLARAAVTEQQLPAGPGRVIPRSRPATRRLVAAIAAAAVFAAGVVGARELVDRNRQIARQEQQLVAQAQALELAGTGEAVILPIDTSGGFADARGSVVVAEDAGRAAVVLAGLEDPEGGVYTVWHVSDGGSPRNVAEFLPGDGGLGVANLEVSVGDRDTVAVTLEPRRGLQSPTGEPVGSATRSA